MIGKKAGDFIGLVDGLVGLINNHQTIGYFCAKMSLWQNQRINLKQKLHLHKMIISPCWRYQPQ